MTKQSMLAGIKLQSSWSKGVLADHKTTTSALITYLLNVIWWWLKQDGGWWEPGLTKTRSNNSFGFVSMRSPVENHFVCPGAIRGSNPSIKRCDDWCCRAGWAVASFTNELRFVTDNWPTRHFADCQFTDYYFRRLLFSPTLLFLYCCFHLF